MATRNKEQCLKGIQAEEDRFRHLNGKNVFSARVFRFTDFDDNIYQRLCGMLYYLTELAGSKLKGEIELD